MDLFIYNYLYKKKKKFIFNYKKKIKIYICGPTVYNKIHIGNLRTFIFFDILRRYIKYIGYNISYVSNITDIGHLYNNEDKIIKKSILKNKKPIEIITKYIYNYHNNLLNLNILPPNIEVLASNNIYEQIKIINLLIKKKFTLFKNKSIYLNINKYIKYFKYGILKNINYKKKGFCIWKKYNQNLINYDSKWGKGYPGWHTECVSIINKYLGNKIHIHGGGIDLKFPHNENEIVHFNILYKKNPSYFWIYVNSLLYNNKKMSKKNNNFICINNLISIKKININYMNIRFFLLYNHYRKLLNYNFNKIKESISIYNKLVNFFFIIKNNIIFKKKNKINVILWIKKNFNYINNDFNIIKLIRNFFYIKKKIIILNYLINKYDILLFKLYYKIFIKNILGIKFILNNKLINLINNFYLLEKKKKKYLLSDNIKKIINIIL
ncbi:MAG: cysteine--tRNA ligase [Candidatus Shikimatogenerans sp. Tcar]|uniref:Cysteine--tRNA ligase n=1 Tax=Candidatus Shikimatogenerans sp. Tcar TaxID=3158565 RepID=A0AAU7QUJ1_9FLAO